MAPKATPNKDVQYRLRNEFLELSGSMEEFSINSASFALHQTQNQAQRYTIARSTIQPRFQPEPPLAP